jgi:hypothetical protein
MPNVENLVMDEELERVTDRVIALERSVRGFWDRRVFRKVLKEYGGLHSRIRNLNVLISRHNYEAENQEGYDPEGETYSRIVKEKRGIFKDAREIYIKIRRGIIDREMEKRYGPGFIEKVGRYEGEQEDFHKYLEQEAWGSRHMHASGMVRVLRQRSERGY